MPQADSNTTGVNAPVAVLPKQVYFPPAVGTPHVTLTNNGSVGVYLGGSGVTYGLGFHLKSGAQISLPFAPYAIWAVSGYQLGTATTTLFTAASAGGTTLTAGSLASMSVGTPLLVGNAGFPSSQETVIISTFVNAGTLTTTTPTQFDHAAGGTVTVISTVNASALSVNVGTT